MPIYEFRCSGCKEEFEDLVRNEADIKSVRCPKCDGAKVERKLSVFGVGASSPSGGYPGPSCSEHSCPGCPHAQH